jgi:hypothetical protein
VNASVSFEVAINNSGGITSITGTITVETGATITAPGAVTPTEETPAPPVNPGGTNTFTTIAAFKAWLGAQPKNTKATAYTVKLNVDDLGGSLLVSGSVGDTLYTNKEKYVFLDLSGSTMTSIWSCAFNDESTISGNGGCDTLTGIIIPNSVTRIETGAFAICRSLASVTIGNSVTRIEEGAFLNCESLASVTIPNSVTSIGLMAFYLCTDLTSATIGSGVKSIGEQAFSYSEKLASVTFQGTIPSSGFSTNYVFIGDLRDKFYADNSTNGTPGTYKTTAPVRWDSE